jgi:hypothetical protein
MPGPELERHFKINEIAEKWNLSEDVVRSLFENEPGVLKFGQPTRLTGRGKYKRRYSYLRIPESVLQRVQDRLMHKRGPSASAPLRGNGQARDLNAG